MNKSIFLCASMDFYQKLVAVEKQLIEKGFKVEIPVSAAEMKQRGDFTVTHFKGKFSHEQKREFIRTNFENIAVSDSILVINEQKNGIPGYIGTNVLMEIAIAFHFQKTIYLFNPIVDTVPYREELLAFGVRIINQDLSLVQ